MTDFNDIEFFKNVGFKFIVESVRSYGSGYVNKYIYDGGKFNPPKDIYVKIVGIPSRSGSIARIVDMKHDSLEDDHHYYRSSYNYFSYYVKFDGRPKTLQFRSRNLEILDDYDGPTIYKFFKKESNSTDIKELQNKFSQKLFKGSLVIGLDYRKRILAGHVSRWTEHNIWIKPYGSFGKEARITKQGEVMLYSPEETIVLSDEIESELFMASLGRK